MIAMKIAGIHFDGNNSREYAGRQEAERTQEQRLAFAMNAVSLRLGSEDRLKWVSYPARRVVSLVRRPDGLGRAQEDRSGDKLLPSIL